MAGKEPEEYRPRRAFTAGAQDDEPSTTILPKVRDARSRQSTAAPAPEVRGTQSRSGPAQQMADDSDDARLSRFSPRTRLALLIAGVAAVVVLGLVFGYAALTPGGNPGTGPGPGTTTGVFPSPGGSGTGDTGGTTILTDAAMVSAEQARSMDAKRSWEVASTQRGLDADSPRPACLGSGPLEGQPSPQQTILRLVSSKGKGAPGLLHQADAYATPEDAAQAYAVTSKAIGGCAMQSAYIASGRTVAGLGDQALGVIVAVADGSTTRFRSLVVNRTGRVINTVDVARAGSAVQISGVAKTLAAATTVQCAVSAGACPAKLSVKDGPPPLGGDQPGFLATADLPPVGSSAPPWVGDPPDLPSPDFTGSQCETLDWSKVPAANRTARTYLQQDSPEAFGLDEIVLTTANAKAAANLVKKIRADWLSCSKRKLTATVSKPRAVEGPGASSVQVTGWTATVQQKATNQTATYRVGMVAAGPKAIFTFLNPVKDLDFSDDQFDAVAVRSGQRASQVQ